jgi:hypothetical protein
VEAASQNNGTAGGGVEGYEEVESTQSALDAASPAGVIR